MEIKVNKEMFYEDLWLEESTVNSRTAVIQALSCDLICGEFIRVSLRMMLYDGSESFLSGKDHF